MKGKTLFITGASRGIGKAIALRAAQEGANIVIASKTTEPHPSLSGTIYSAAKEIEAAGGQALPLAVDIRKEDQIAAAVKATIEKFGGIDILVNNASAIALVGTENISEKKFDLLQQVNIRGTFLCSKYCLPHLLKAENPHILTISPPINLNPQWFQRHTAYTISKYGMSLCVIGLAAEFSSRIAVNALWPKYLIGTAATEMLAKMVPGMDANCFRKPEIMADAAFEIFTKTAPASGQFYIDEDVLLAAGVKDFSQYASDPSQKPIPDLFLDLS
jgi:citronellol/citronellal dehydrogenase